MDRQNKKPDWLFYLAWVIFSALAIPLALGGTFPILAAITNQIGGYITVNGQRHIAEDYLFMFIFVPLLCLLTSFLQAVSNPFWLTSARISSGDRFLIQQ